MSIRILLADDHPIFSNGTRTLLEGDVDLRVVATVDSADTLLCAITHNNIDLLITDFNMPGAGLKGGLELLAHIKEARADLPVIVLTMTSTPGILRSIVDAGVAGLVSKLDTVSQLPMAARSVMMGKRYISKAVTEMLRLGDVEVQGGLERLTAKELDVLMHIISGSSVTQVAASSGRSVKTISSQKVAAMEKLGLRSDLELFAYARQYKL